MIVNPVLAFSLQFVFRIFCWREVFVGFHESCACLLRAKLQTKFPYVDIYRQCFDASASCLYSIRFCASVIDSIALLVLVGTHCTRIVVARSKISWSLQLCRQPEFKTLGPQRPKVERLE